MWKVEILKYQTKLQFQRVMGFNFFEKIKNVLRLEISYVQNKLSNLSIFSKNSSRPHKFDETSLLILKQNSNQQRFFFKFLWPSQSKQTLPGTILIETALRGHTLNTLARFCLYLTN